MSIWFEKISYEQYRKDYFDCFDNATEESCQKSYSIIQLPKRATSGSAGYDFITPVEIKLSCPFNKYGQHSIKIPTGICCAMPKNVVLMLYPRSGLGFKNQMYLNNTVGIIDSDYIDAENHGHIMAKIKVVERDLTLNAGDRFMQGVFVNYLITDDDTTDAARTGGFGSTGVR